MKTLAKLISLILALLMLAGAIASCNSGEQPTTVTPSGAATTGADTPGTQPAGTESPTESAPADKSITSLKLSKKGMELHIGESQQLEYVVMPADADTSGLVWSAQDISVATVENGKVTAVGLGSTKIFLKTYDGVISLACDVNVVEGEIKNIPVQSIKTPASLVILKKGEQYDFACQALPENATDKTLQYRVESAASATIDQTGRVTATEAGVNRIIVTSGRIEEQCLLIIKNTDGSLPAALTGTKSVQIGKSAELSAPEALGGIALTYASSAEAILSVSGTTVTALKTGSARVTGKDEKGNELYIVNVTVTEIPTDLPVTGIKLNKDKITVKVGETVSLTATLQPEGAIQRKIEWINESKGELYTVTQTGEITGVKVGSKYVTVYVSEPTTGKSYTAVCMVNVVEGGGDDPTPPAPSGKVTGIKLEKDRVTLKVGETYQIAYTLLPAGNENVKVEFINEAKKFSDYLEIDVKTGTVKALKPFTPTDKQPAITIYIDGSKTESGKSITKCIWITVTE